MKIVPAPTAVLRAEDTNDRGVAAVSATVATAAATGRGPVTDGAGGGFGAVDFALAAQALAEQSRTVGLQAPDFRSPPQVLGLTRSLRRRPDGSVTIAVAFKNRPRSSVLADMIEGIVAANQLGGVDAARARDDLWSGLELRRANAA